MLKLYSYYRSSAAYRVRIALHSKGLDFETVPVHLVQDGGQQHTTDYRQLNPQALVPTLITENGDALTQSLAIIEYLDETYPQPALLPKQTLARAQVRSLAQLIACETHPLNNLRVLQYLKNTLHVTDECKDAWYAHWIQLSFAAMEQRLQDCAGQYCFGDQVTLADLCLIPQVYNAERFNVALHDYPLIARINQACLALPAFAQALPEAQVDAS